MDWQETEIGPAVTAGLCCSSCRRLQLLHPFEVMRIVDDAVDDFARLVGERRVALRTEHLVAAAHLGNRRSAAGAGTTVLDDFGDGGD